MTGLSLFTGIGGMDLAFEAAGGRVIAMCECDEFCRSILHRHWPDIPVHNDVKTLRGGEIEAVDIIYGGFPCQPFSCAGSRNGKNDERHLWPEFSRLVGEIGPAWVVAENVPGILTLAADDVCEDLERQGYAVGIFHYEAAAVGAPHRRARIFFVAHSEGRRLRSREREPRGGSEKTGEKPNHQAPGSGESSEPVPYPGRRMRERSAVGGAVCGEPGEKTPADAERSGGASVPNTEGGGWIEGPANAGRNEKSAEPGAWDRPADVHAAVSDADGTRRPQPKGEFRAFGGRAGGVSERADVSHLHGERFQKQYPAIAAYGERAAFRPAERGCGRQPEPGLGGVADGFPLWLDGDWWRDEPDIPRVAPRGIFRRAARLKSLGNAVVPAQIYPLFAAIALIHGDYDRNGES